jgi:hypothetical protein
VTGASVVCPGTAAEDSGAFDSRGAEPDSLADEPDPEEAEEPDSPAEVPDPEEDAPDSPDSEEGEESDSPAEEPASEEDEEPDPPAEEPVSREEELDSRVLVDGDCAAEDASEAGADCSAVVELARGA